MSKTPDVTTIQSGYYSTTMLNDNFANIAAAFNNTVSRDGSSPNSMSATLDMNNKDVINVKNFQADYLSIGGTTVDLSALNTVVGIGTDISVVAGISTDVVNVANNEADITRFSGVYYGASASNPATRRDGSALEQGDLYWNSTSDNMFAWNGSGWEVSYAPSGAFLSTLNNLSDLTNAGDARTNLGLGSIALQNAGSVSISGGTVSNVTLTSLATDLAITDGGTGADTGWEALVNLGAFDSEETGAIDKGLRVPSGTTAARPSTPDSTQIRYNTTDATFEGYDGSIWGPIGGGGGLYKGENGAVGDPTTGAGDIFRVNEQTLNTNVTIDADENASAAGPLEIASGVTITVTSGGTLVIL